MTYHDEIELINECVFAAGEAIDIVALTQAHIRARACVPDRIDARQAVIFEDDRASIAVTFPDRRRITGFEWPVRL